MAKLYWGGSNPTCCDICHQQFETQMVDGKTDQGPWGLLCVHCHESHGVGLGTGRGQLYELQAEGRWLKIDG